MGLLSACGAAHAGIVIALSPVITTEISADIFDSTPPAYRLFAIDSKVGLTGRANLVRSGFQHLYHGDAFSIVLENANNGSFVIPTTPDVEWYGMQVPKQIDYNSDGVEDIVFLNKTSLSALAAEFALFTSTSLTDITAIPGPSVVGAIGLDRGMIDNDPKPDVVVERRIVTGFSPILTSFAWYIGNGAGGFDFDGERTLPEGSLARGEDAIALADYNLDGHADVCIAAETPGVPGQTTMYVFLNDGHGSYPASASATTVGPADSIGLGLQSADFNGDGAPDLLFLHQDTGWSPYADPRGFPNIWMNKNDGSSTFNTPVQLLSNRFHHAVIADMDRDGDPDIVLARLIDTTTPFVYDAFEVVILERVMTS